MQIAQTFIAAAASALLLASIPALGAEPASGEKKNGETKSKFSPEEKKQRQDALLKYSEESLQKLYAIKPETRKIIENAVGYAVFDLSAVNIVMVVGQRGKGVLFDNKTKKPTYMLATRAGTGPGLGYREIRQVFVFKSKEAMDQFKLGDAVGGDVSAAVSVGKESGQLSFNPYIDVYQITEKGLAVEAQWGGTVYRVDPDLN
jgi:lipid-binding SYLF domain-containing protein